MFDKWKLGFFGLFLTCFLFLGLIQPGVVFASSESIESFNSQITTHQDGSFDVQETIRYDFGDNERHGIYRNIPKVSTVGDLYRVIDINFTQILRDGESEKYSTTNTAEKISVKIGQADKTLTGPHTYLLAYRVENGIGSNYADHDEIYWNVTGNEWEVPILSASATLKTDFGVNDNKVVCYTGPSGSTSKNCAILESFPEIIRTTQSLNVGEGLTVVWGFPVNTFPKSVLTEKPPTVSSFPIISLLIGGWILLNLILAPGLLVWYFKKKNKKRFGLPTPNFDIPKDDSGKRLAPAEAGTIDMAKLERDDVLATIFDLAIRKYIKIEQVKKKSKILGIIGTSHDDYSIRKLKDYSDVAPFEKVLLDEFFESGDSIQLSALKSTFYLAFQEIDKEVFKSLIGKTYYSKNPKVQRGLLYFLAIFSVFSLNFFLSGVFFFLARKLNGRTALGDEIDFKIDGLKLFLKNMSRNYKWQAEKLYIVEQMIPYAIALGYIKQFMEQLKIIYPDYKPSWYSGNLAFYSISNNMLNSMNASLTTASPSSSGFSGGGSSGGGGGGGGGGSW